MPTGDPCMRCFSVGCVCNTAAPQWWNLPGVSHVTYTTTTLPITTAPAKGWECPRCQAINAPHASQCTCVPNFAPPTVAPDNTGTPWPYPGSPWTGGGIIY